MAQPRSLRDIAAELELKGSLVNYAAGLPGNQTEAPILDLFDLQALTMLKIACRQYAADRRVTNKFLNAVTEKYSGVALGMESDECQALMAQLEDLDSATRIMFEVTQALEGKLSAYA